MHEADGDPTANVAATTAELPASAPVRDRNRSSVFWILLGLILAGGLAIRMYGVLEYRELCGGVPPPPPGECPAEDFRVWGDPLFYHVQGRLLADGEGFIDPYRSLYDEIREPTANHPPLYGLFLAGITLLGGETPTAHRLASTVLGTATVLVLALLARRLIGDRAGIATAAVVAVYPALWVNDYLLLSETMAAFLIAVALFATYRFTATPSVRRAAVMGAAMAAAALGRAELALLVPLVVVPLCWLLLARWREMLCGLAAAGLAALAVTGPWMAFNLNRFEEPTLLSSGLGLNLSAGSCDLAWYGEYMGWYFCSYQGDPARGPDEVEVVEDGVLGPEPTGDQSERDVVVRRHALDYIGDHIERAPLVAATRVGRMWFVYKPGQTEWLDGTIEGRGAGAAELVRWSSYFMTAAAVVGLVVMRRQRITILPVVGLVVTVSIAAALTFGIPRYRVPADVGLAFAAGIGLAWLFDRVVKPRGGADESPAVVVREPDPRPEMTPEPGRA